MVLGVGGLHGAELEQVEDFDAVGQVAVELPPPAIGGVVGRVRHHVVMNLGLGLVLDGGPEHVYHDRVHLLRAHRHLEDVVLAPGHGHAALAKNADPVVRVPQVHVIVMG